MPRKTGQLLLLVFVVLFLGRAVALGQVLVVNVADSAAVTFTGTGTFASNNFNSGTSDAFPVRLSGFFTSAQTNFDFVTAASTLMTTGAGHTLGLAFLRVGAGGPTTLLMRQSGNSQENFSTSSAAFSGAATFDMSSVASALPTAGASGTIFASDGTTAIGTYSVVSSVPEPSACGVIAGLAGFVFAMRRKAGRRPEKQKS